MSILNETTDLLELGMHLAGRTEVPRQWFEWSLISMIAASVGDRVYYQRFPWERLHPNMYIFLIGPSGTGKGQAINFALQLEHPVQNLWFGEATNKGLKDVFGSSNSIRPADGSTPPWVIHLVQTEMADAVGPGNMANALIKSMTNWYNPTKHNFSESTRTHGEKMHPPPVINWLAGSTVEWLLESINREALLSGFFGRVVPVPGDYDWSVRIYDPMDYAPSDYEDVLVYVCQRINALTAIPLDTPMTIRPEARRIDKVWYEEMQPPERELIPFFRRMPDLSTKLAMIFSLCRSQSLVIEEDDIFRAHRYVTKALRDLRDLMNSSIGSRSYLIVESIISFLRQRGGWVSRQSLVSHGNKWRISPKEMDELIKEADAMGKIEQRKRSGRNEYRYKSTTAVNLRLVNDDND